MKGKGLKAGIGLLIIALTAIGMTGFAMANRANHTKSVKSHITKSHAADAGEDSITITGQVTSSASRCTAKRKVYVREINGDLGIVASTSLAGKTKDDGTFSVEGISDDSTSAQAIVKKTTVKAPHHRKIICGLGKGAEY